MFDRVLNTPFLDVIFCNDNIFDMYLAMHEVMWISKQFSMQLHINLSLSKQKRKYLRKITSNWPYFALVWPYFALFCTYVMHPYN